MSLLFFARFFNAIAIGSVIALLAACGTPYPESRQVRANYSQQWAERAQAYSESLPENANAEAIPKGSSASDPLSAFDIADARTRGSLDILEDFTQFRQSKPVLSVAKTWLNKQLGVQVAAMRGLNLTSEQLRLLSESNLKEPIYGVPDRKRAELAYRIGALNELGRIADELSEFGSEYLTAYSHDRSNWVAPSQSLDSTTMDAIINGAIAGALIGSGK